MYNKRYLHNKNHHPVRNKQSWRADDLQTPAQAPPVSAIQIRKELAASLCGESEACVNNDNLGLRQDDLLHKPIERAFMERKNLQEERVSY